MSATVADLNPKSLENAKRQFVELYGSALVMNTYLTIAPLLVCLLPVGLLALNFLTRFVATHCSRLRGTVQRDYPDSLFFLDPTLADATIAQNEQTRIMETYL